MKNILFSTAAFFLPTASHAFLASRALVHSQSSLFQQQYNYDQGDDGQYYGGEEGQQQQYYDQQQQQQQQQYYDQQQQQQQQQQGYVSGGEEEPSLLITNNMQEEMTRATAGVDVGIDYLALARQRAAQRTQSNNSDSTSAEWIQLADEKKRILGDNAAFADDDGWEASLEDEGSIADSAALGMGVKLEEGEGGVMMTEGGLVVDNAGDEEGGEGPQLLL